MLNLMRKHAGGWMIKMVLFAIVVVFVFWGVGRFRSDKGTQVAEVNGTIISYDTYRQAYLKLLDHYRSIYSGQMNDEMLKMLRLNEQALNQLIDNVLLLQEAERLKIRASQKELADLLRRNPAFQNNGVFDFQRYRLILAQNNLSPEEFEQRNMENLRIEKLQALLLPGVVVSDDEARQWYDWFNAEISLTYVSFAPARYQGIAPSTEDATAYFKEHQQEYQTEPMVKVRYLYFNPESYQAQVNVTDAQVSQYYEDHPKEFSSEKTVEARHILLKVAPDADEKTVAAVKEKAMQIYSMAKSGKDFAELAKQYSEDATRERGGFLGAFKKEAMVKPFADQAFAMAPGEVSAPVRTQYGWHIIKVEKVNAASEESLQAAAGSIRSKLVDEQSRAMARAKAESVYDAVFDGDDLEAAGQKFQVPVMTTDFVARSTPQIKGVGNLRQFLDTALALEKMAISEIQDLGNGYYLLQVVDRREAQTPAFEAVAEKVTADLVKVRQDERAKADAEAFLADLKKGETMTALSARYNLQPLSTGFFKRTGAIPQIGYEPQINQAVFQLSVEKPLYEKPIKGKQGWYVVQLKERRRPSADAFAKESAAVIKRLTEQKKQETFQRWLADLRQRSKIAIHEELIK